MSDDPHPLDPIAYFKGTQPLWRAFWLWFVCGSGSIGLGYFGVEVLLSYATTDDSWLPMIRCLRVWSVLGVSSLIVIIRNHQNASSPVAGMVAFAIAGLPTACCLFLVLVVFVG